MTLWGCPACPLTQPLFAARFALLHLLRSFQEGPDLHILLLRLTLLFNGLYTAVILVTFGPAAYKTFGKTEFIAFCILAAIPFYCQITGKMR